jgi:CubicO group peptidase (beta-lactamase class C family)
MFGSSCAPRSRRNLIVLSAACLACSGSAAAAPARSATTPATPARIDPAALAALEQRAKDSESDAVVIYQDGVLVAEWYFGKPEGPIEAMSATKSIVNLAIGRLLDTGALHSLDQPVSELFPEWRQGKKRTITIRQLMNHTSGLQNEPRADLEIYPSPDFIQLALAAELSDPPGSRFAYNNKAINLLAAIVQRASGQRMDQYLRDQIFTPMGITDFAWSLDPAGSPQGMAGFQVRARDLAKLGQMMLDRGVWHGKRVLSAAWIAESTQPSQSMVPRCGLLWWLLRDSRVPEIPLLPAPIAGYYADGFLGQFLVVIPAARIVAVRQRRSPDDAAKIDDLRLSFGDFPELVRALTH